MISRFTIGLFFWIFVIQGLALCQEEVISMEGITDAEFDLQGNLYLSAMEGSIIKFDTSYHKLVAYTTEKMIPVTSLDVTNRFRIFGYYKNNQSYILLDQNFKILNENSMDPRLVGNGVAACYASDHTIWIFDDLDFSIKKLNPSLNQVIIDIQLPLLVEANQFVIIQLEEYQNRIYVNNLGNGVYVFDTFGNFLKELKISTRHIFKIFNEKLYYIDHSRIKSIHIYTNDTEILPEIQNPDNLLTVLINNLQMVLIYPDCVRRIK